MSSVRAQLGKNIQRLRREQSLPIERLASMTGKPASTLRGIEQGKKRLSVDALACICRHLNTTPNDLYGWDADNA